MGRVEVVDLAVTATHDSGCPECGAGGDVTNIGRFRFLACHEHQFAWNVDTRILDATGREYRRANDEREKLLETYRVVEPPWPSSMRPGLERL